MMKRSVLTAYLLSYSCFAVWGLGCNAQAEAEEPKAQDVKPPASAPAQSEVSSAPKAEGASFSVLKDMKIKGEVKEDGAFVCRKGSCASGIVAFGPYTQAVSPGPRVATFRVSGLGLAALDHPAVTLDVYDALGKQKLAARSINGVELPDGAQKDLEVAFTAPEKSNLEFRISWNGEGELRMYQVDVH